MSDREQHQQQRGVPHLRISPQRFIHEFMRNNEPVILCGLTDSWPACRDWLLPSSSPAPSPPDASSADPASTVQHHVFPSFPSVSALLSHAASVLAAPPPPCLPLSEPDLLHLASLAPDSTPPIADCSQPSHPRSCSTTAARFFRNWHAARSSSPPCRPPLLYLKDWHLPLLLSSCSACSSSPPFYSTPPHFEDDWLNEFALCADTAACDDYRFVYAGPRGCSTAVHCDVLRSFSWSANVVGRKLWLLFPPACSRLLSTADGEQTMLDPLDVSLHPLLPSLLSLPPSSPLFPRLCLQEQSETIFVPSCWHHAVWQLDDAVSINHNWSNAACIAQTERLIREEELQARAVLLQYQQARLQSLRRRRDDRRNAAVEGQADAEVDADAVQMMVKANAGMNREGLRHWLQWVRERELQRLTAATAKNNEREGETDNGWRAEYHRMSLAVIDEIISRMQVIQSAAVS